MVVIIYTLVVYVKQITQLEIILVRPLPGRFLRLTALLRCRGIAEARIIAETRHTFVTCSAFVVGLTFSHAVRVLMSKDYAQSLWRACVFAAWTYRTIASWLRQVADSPAAAVRICAAIVADFAATSHTKGRGSDN